MTRLEDVPRILAAVGRALGPFIVAVGWNQAALRLEGVPERWRRIDAFDARVEHLTLGHLFRPEWHQPPAAHADLVIPVVGRGHERHFIGRGDVIARRVVATDICRRSQAVEPVDFGPWQISCVAPAHARPSVPQGFRDAERPEIQNSLIGAPATPDTASAPVLPVTLGSEHDTAEVVKEGCGSRRIGEAVKPPLFLLAVSPNSDHGPGPACHSALLEESPDEREVAIGADIVGQRDLVRHVVIDDRRRRNAPTSSHHG